MVAGTEDGILSPFRNFRHTILIFLKFRFTLEQGVLFYYKSKPNPEDTFSGYIDLNLYFLSEDPKYTTRRKYCMRLHNIKYKTWFLATDTDEARKEWIAAMMPYTLFGKKSSNKDLVPPSDPNSDLIRFDDEPATPTSTNAGPVLSPMSADSFSPERFDWVDPDERVMSKYTSYLIPLF